jgi:peptidoglycan hydrolase-like protein with peptidoglycan-binding domain
MSLVYRKAGLRLTRGTRAAPAVIRALQRDLRRLGYLRSGLDGQFGHDTEQAVRSLQWDLLFNNGAGPDGTAPVPLTSHNGGRVAAVTGVVDERLAGCLEDILRDGRVPSLPRSRQPARDNRRVLEEVRSVAAPVPVPFLLAIVEQESGGRHFRVPIKGDTDNFIVVGLDRNDRTNPDHITSRGYGIGQYTLFHHPPRPDEVEGLMLDPERNVARAIEELAEKFDHFVAGGTSATRADDRLDEIGAGPLRRCRYAPEDPRYLRDCHRCALDAGTLSIGPTSRLRPGAPEVLAPTPYHPETHYDDVPDRARLGCDWPYAARRYNGSGLNSYHYQFQVLQRIRRGSLS